MLNGGLSAEPPKVLASGERGDGRVGRIGAFTGAKRGACVVAGCGGRHWGSGNGHRPSAGVVERRWAGLRSFAPDRRPVYGYDPQVEGFAWFAGQGGFGIQTAPAAARLGAQLLLGLERDEMTAPLDAGLYTPDRFG